MTATSPRAQVIQNDKRRPAIPAAFFVAVLAVAGSALAQDAYRPPRHSDGHPDLEGDWNNSSLTTLERPMAYGQHLTMTDDEAAAIEDSFTDFFVPTGAPTTTFSFGQGGDFDAFTSVMRVGRVARTGFITSTPAGRVPDPKAGANLTPTPSPTEAEMSANPENQPAMVRCLPNMTPNASPVMLPGGYSNNFRIVQGPTAVAIMIQMADAVRVIRLGGRHRTDGVRPWMGDSIGRWEGDKLVVETTNFPKAQAFEGSWEHLKVTETFSRAAEDRLLYQFRVEDPDIWNAPWSGEYEFARSPHPIDEYACHENDYTLQFSLEAARYEEAHPPAKQAPSP